MAIPSDVNDSDDDHDDAATEVQTRSVSFTKSHERRVSNYNFRFDALFLLLLLLLPLQLILPLPLLLPLPLPLLQPLLAVVVRKMKQTLIDSASSYIRRIMFVTDPWCLVIASNSSA